VSQDDDISDRPTLECPLAGIGTDGLGASARLPTDSHIAAPWAHTTGFDV